MLERMLSIIPVIERRGPQKIARSLSRHPQTTLKAFIGFRGGDVSVDQDHTLVPAVSRVSIDYGIAMQRLRSLWEDANKIARDSGGLTIRHYDDSEVRLASLEAMAHSRVKEVMTRVPPTLRTSVAESMLKLFYAVGISNK